MKSSIRWSLTLISTSTLLLFSPQYTLAATGNVQLRMKTRITQPVSNIGNARKYRHKESVKKPSPGVLNKENPLAKQGRLPVYGSRDPQIKTVSAETFQAARQKARQINLEGLRRDLYQVCSEERKTNRLLARTLRACRSQAKSSNGEKSLGEGGKANPQTRILKKTSRQGFSNHRSETRLRSNRTQTRKNRFQSFLRNPVLGKCNSCYEVSSPSDRNLKAPMTSMPKSTSFQWTYETLDPTFLFNSANYVNNLDDFVGTIDAPAGSDAMRVHFLYLDMENSYDYVTLFDSDGNECDFLTGRNLDDFWSADCIGDSVDIYVHTDSSLTYNGFEIDAIEYGYETSNEAPIAIANASNNYPEVGDSVRFDSDASYDPDGYIASCSWDFGDGTDADTCTAWHSYVSAGDYSVSLTIWDNQGAMDSDTIIVSAWEQQPAALDYYLITAAARVSGANGTFWVTDLSLFNPTNMNLSVTLSYIPAKNAATLADAQVFVGAFQTLFLADIISSAFGSTVGNGAIEIFHEQIGVEHPLIITSRTFNSGGTNPTNGQFVGAVEIDDQFGFGLRGLQQITQNSEFRTNIIMVSTNPTQDPSDVEISCYDEFSNQVGSKIFSLLDREYMNVSLRTFVNGTYEDVNCEVQTHEGYVFVGSSTVDNRAFSGDAVYIPEIASSPRPNLQVIPGVASTPGLEGTYWVTDVVTRNNSDTAITYDMTYYPSLGGLSYSSLITLAAHETLRFNDILNNEFSLDGGSGFIIVESVTGTAPVVTARTYNIVWDTAGLVLGTFGQYIPVANALANVQGPAASTSQDVAHLINGPVGSSSFRSNIGFVNPTGASATVTVTLYDAKGDIIGRTISNTVGSFQSKQITDVFAAAGVSQSNYQGARAEISSTQPVVGYASVVDNNSGDPIYIPGYPATF